MTHKGGKRKQAPAYSTDTMALRYFAGLLLAAVGVLVFMAVDLGMGNQANARDFFSGLRRLCFGLSGSLAYGLAMIPLWAGVLVIWSTQRRAPVRPWLFGVLGFIGMCTFIMLISGNAMKDLDRLGQGSWGGVIGSAFTNGERTGHGGGASGVILGWPLWKLVPSEWLWAVVLFLATAFCLLMMVNMTPRRIKELITGQAANHRSRNDRVQAQTESQQILWQQQQAMQQQAVWEQQQRQIIEQQQLYRDQQNLQYQQQAQSYLGNDMNRNSSAADVQHWQEQMTAQQAAASPAQAQHQSRIFSRRDISQPEKADKPRGGWIFGRRKTENDGLVENNSAAVAKALREAAEESTRRTATGVPITQPATRWTTAGRTDLPAADDAGYDAAGRDGRNMKTSRQEDSLHGERENRGDGPAVHVQPRTPVEAANAQRKQTAPEDMDIYRRPQPEPAGRSAGTRRTEQKIPEEQPAAEETRPAGSGETRGRRTSRTGNGSTGRIPAPAVQQTIGEEAYRPRVKLPQAPTPDRTPEDDEWTPTPYTYPPITDLAMPEASEEDTAAEDEMRSRKLEETLASFKVQARVVHVTHGPAISRFEMELAAGTKVGNVAKLEKDIAYGMEATSVRIEAPIPGKSLVGVEVPNRKVATVTLREVLQSERMQNAKSLLTVALGKDIAGTPIVCDLAKMPHMLIAGQTGSGKSVCINAIINSLLYRAGPEEVKLILVDPKVVELQCYNGIPHLLIPVVNDPHKAAAALAWAVAEMMERYDKFAERKVRNLDGYNSNLKKGEKPMTRIVIIIDELADLMMVCKKDVEEYICRITQLARAAGIHLIVATQRPSVDVITGLIKANIPSRIAFKTASQVDSRTILDRNGSEQLLGWGDMLYQPTGSFAPTRVQGCFLSDEEVNKIVKHVRDANPSTYDPDILEKLQQIENGSAGDMSGADMIGGTGEVGGTDGGLFEQAVEFAISDGQISTSTLQRRLKIGYARAGRLTDEMEERGIVAAKDGSKPRKCLITREEWEEMKKTAEDLA